LYFPRKLEEVVAVVPAVGAPVGEEPVVAQAVVEEEVVVVVAAAEVAVAVAVVAAVGLVAAVAEPAGEEAELVAAVEVWVHRGVSSGISPIAMLPSKLALSSLRVLCPGCSFHFHFHCVQSLAARVPRQKPERLR
jgi:hypothetical protein